MENVHDWINSGILVILGVLLYSQRTILARTNEYVKMLDPNKLKQANDFIRESMEHEVNSKVNKEKKKILDHVSKRIEQTEGQFYQQWEELLQIPFNVMSPLTWPEREERLKFYPKTGETLRELLKAYDTGELQEFAKKHSNPS